MSTTAGERPSAGRPSVDRLGAGRYLAAGRRPESTITSVHELTTADGATVRGVLATVPGATTVVSLMHPRQDLTHHPLVPLLLLACIDPSVGDEQDPMSVVPELGPFSPANRFAEPPASSAYTEEFLARYRTAQRHRVAHIDAVARGHLARTAEARTAFGASGDPLDRRRSLAPRIITVFRTDADPRTVDLSLDPSERPYGSLFGKRPDLINYGLTGFGRLTTPEAWLSTWSGLSSNADFVRCARGVTVPTLFIELTGDQAAFPADSRRMTGALSATDLTTAAVRGLHFGGPIGTGEPAGNELAAAEIIAWLAKRHELTPPA
ncbi:MAG: hypothetical protein ACXVW7_06650 [Trebonia sp.]